MLAFFGQRNDPHIDRVQRFLGERGEVVRFLPAISLEPRQEMSWAADGNRVAARLNDFAEGDPLLLWLRNKTQIRNFQTEQDQQWHQAMLEREAWLKGWVAARGGVELNGAGRERHRSKIVQLSAARRVGFAIPPTCVTNCRADALAFLKQHPDAIVKPLSVSVIPSHNPDLEYAAFMTNRVTLEEVEQSSEDSWAAAPVILQARVEKAFEMRLIQIHDRSIGVRIGFDENAPAPIDYRRDTQAASYSLFGVPEWLTQLCHTYLRENFLHMGVFDFAVTPDGEYVFFECNEAGQWVWLEQEMPDQPLSRFVAEGIAELMQHIRRERKRVSAHSIVEEPNGDRRSAPAASTARAFTP